MDSLNFIKDLLCQLDLMIIIGSLIVIGSGLFTTWREYQLKDKN